MKEIMNKEETAQLGIGAVSRSINEILAKFENGVELYQANAVFANCVESLLKGGDVYKILERVIVMHYEQQKRYKELIESGTLRTEIVVTKEHFDEIANGRL